VKMRPRLRRARQRAKSNVLLCPHWPLVSSHRPRKYANSAFLCEFPDEGLCLIR